MIAPESILTQSINTIKGIAYISNYRKIDEYAQRTLKNIFKIFINDFANGSKYRQLYRCRRDPPDQGLKKM